MKEYKHATVKYNSGEGALLCSCCGAIIASGFEHKDTTYYCSPECKVMEDFDLNQFYGEGSPPSWFIIYKNPKGKGLLSKCIMSPIKSQVGGVMEVRPLHNFSLLDLQYEESTGLVSDNELEVSIQAILPHIKGVTL